VFSACEILYDNALYKFTLHYSAHSLKQRLLAYFPNTCAQHQGHDVLLAFNEDLGDALAKACELDTDTDTVHLQCGIDAVSTFHHPQRSSAQPIRADTDGVCSSPSRHQHQQLGEGHAGEDTLWSYQWQDQGTRSCHWVAADKTVVSAATTAQPISNVTTTCGFRAVISRSPVDAVTSTPSGMASCQPSLVTLEKFRTMSTAAARKSAGG